MRFCGTPHWFSASHTFYKVGFNPHRVEFFWSKFKMAIPIKSLNTITLSNHALEKLFSTKLVLNTGGIFARTIFDHLDEIANFEFWFCHITDG